MLDKKLISHLDILQVDLKMTRKGWLNFSHPREHFIGGEGMRRYEMMMRDRVDV